MHVLNEIVCSSVGIILLEGLALGLCDIVGRTVGPVNVGLDDTEGGEEGASLGWDARVIAVENSISNVTSSLPDIMMVPNPVTMRS